MCIDLFSRQQQAFDKDTSLFLIFLPWVTFLAFWHAHRGQDGDQQEGPGFESGGQPGPFSEFACFPAPAWVFPGTPASSRNPKACISDSKLSLYVNSCLSE